MSTKTLYIKGQLIGKLLFIREVENKNNRRQAEFSCKCGDTVVTYISYAKVKDVTECAKCALERKRATVIARNTVHHLRKHPLYNMYNTMKQRCYNPNSSSYPNYGAKGIKVCQRWLDSFENFLQDMGERPSLKHTLERQNIKEGYTPQNTIWLPRKFQSRNTSRTIFITYKGIKRTLVEWSELLGVKWTILYSRIFTYKIPLEIAMNSQKLPNKKILQQIDNSLISYSFGFIG